MHLIDVKFSNLIIEQAIRVDGISIRNYLCILGVQEFRYYLRIGIHVYIVMINSIIKLSRVIVC